MKNLPLSLAAAAVSGALTLLRPADWSSRTRRAFVLVPGALAAATLAGGLFPGGRKQSGTGSAAAGAALALGVGTLVSGLQTLSLHWDARLERWLVRRGLPQPRLLMGAAVALVTLAVDLLGDRGEHSKADPARRRRS